MTLHFIARFRVRDEAAGLEALRTVAAATRQEPGCLDVQVLRGVRDPQLFHIHSQFGTKPLSAPSRPSAHGPLPGDHRKLIDWPREITRAERVE